MPAINDAIRKAKSRGFGIEYGKWEWRWACARCEYKGSLMESLDPCRQCGGELIEKVSARPVYQLVPRPNGPIRNFLHLKERQYKGWLAHQTRGEATQYDQEKAREKADARTAQAS